MVSLSLYKFIRNLGVTSTIMRWGYLFCSLERISARLSCFSAALPSGLAIGGSGAAGGSEGSCATDVGWGFPSRAGQKYHAAPPQKMTPTNAIIMLEANTAFLFSSSWKESTNTTTIVSKNTAMPPQKSSPEKGGSNLR